MTARNFLDSLSLEVLELKPPCDLHKRRGYMAARARWTIVAGAVIHRYKVCLDCAVAVQERYDARSPAPPFGEALQTCSKIPS